MNNSKPISSGLGVRESLGETAVDFTYGPPLGSETKFQRRRHLSGNPSTNDLEEDKAEDYLMPATPIYWPIFCLHGNGNIYCFLSGLGDNAIYQPDIIGPLPFYPQAEDNYEAGSNGGYKSILCLQPAHPASPPILVTANNLTVYHAIVLNSNQQIQNRNSDDNDEINYTDTESLTGSDWSSSVFGRIKNNKRAAPNLSLHVYESLELNPSLTEESNQDKHTSIVEDEYPVDTSVDLISDASTPLRYFCCHSGGIHGVTLPMVAQLKEMAEAEEAENSGFGVANVSEDSSVDHLLCTKPKLLIYGGIFRHICYTEPTILSLFSFSHFF
jgi:nuclear pore complex protein Nup88